VLDFSADLHGHVIEYACDQDRRWFDEHPGETCYVRLAVEHELCDPRAAAQGRCVPAFTVPAGARLVIKVTQVEPGFRLRRPGYFMVGPLDEDGEAS
jgi:hypothetical protein